MTELRYTLVTDGSSDAALIPILNWLLRSNGVTWAIQAEWADLGRYSLPEKPKLADKIERSLYLYPCNLLFVHRDAEKEPREKRVEEINRALEKVTKPNQVPPAVCVVPVRMQEAWLLFDEAAIRYAAGNRSGRQPLDLPPIKKLENLPNPKAELYNHLRRASNLSGRRLKRFPVSRRVLRVTEYIDDFSPLRVLPAFTALENDIKQIINQQSWACPKF